MNRHFATMLAIALVNQKINSSTVVNEFIETHGVDNKLDSTKNVENTPEINEFLKSFYKKGLKIKDNLLKFIFDELYENIGSSERKPSAILTDYYAQEH